MLRFAQLTCTEMQNSVAAIVRGHLTPQPSPQMAPQTPQQPQPQECAKEHHAYLEAVAENTWVKEMFDVESGVERAIATSHKFVRSNKMHVEPNLGAVWDSLCPVLNLVSAAEKLQWEHENTDVRSNKRLTSEDAFVHQQVSSQ
ncbi:hypothetical protein L596_000921 [Steinernema carpocapsae]|uniref:Uncharacterized protein n=1 Tax=Steinernema carpocapsae TaxID=34508 RepID=A0A4U8UM00_STECR|nr:hypothetical protein L596_000921 [Steinernema carpocapsae]